MMEKVQQLDHVAIAVWDIDVSLAYYVGQLGLQLIEDEQLEAAGVRIAYLDAGTTMIQLLQPIGDTPIRQFLEKQGEGLHHLCFCVEDIPKTLNGLSNQTDVKIVKGGRNRRACFLKDTPSGVPIELTEADPI